MPFGQERPEPMTPAEAIIALLRDTRDQLVRVVERRFGITRAYIEDIRDNIRFEDSRVDVVTFLARLDGATGAVTLLTGANGTLRIHPEYLFGVRRVGGFVTNPAAMAGNVALIEATIRENGRSQDAFTAPINMASIIPGTGSDRIEFETPYVFREGAEISCTFALRAAPPAWVAPAADQLIGLFLVGDLVRKKILP